MSQLTIRGFGSKPTDRIRQDAAGVAVLGDKR